MPDSAKVVKALLEKYGRTFSDELGIKLESNTPSMLFRWLCAALLFSARISNKIATQAALALTKHGWTSAQKMAAATWKQRTLVLNRAGYARYDEKTSRMLADASELLLDRYGGDLRKLREEAERDPRRKRELLMECKGIGEVGASIFLREVQVVWPENIPFADQGRAEIGAKTRSTDDRGRAVETDLEKEVSAIAGGTRTMRTREGTRGDQGRVVHCPRINDWEDRAAVTRVSRSRLGRSAT
ncbi:MAG TPA: hypothetical protein VIS96_14705 [Terrimicrobiaceae bacterium]